VNAAKRRYLSYMPASEHSADLPLWLLFPGTDETPEFLLDYTGFGSFAEKHGIAYAAFEGVAQQEHQRYFNVGLHAQPLDDAPDDVAFVRRVIDEMLGWPCIDQRRVHCAGFSNGGRFCALLASELSRKIASVAIVAGLRYPEPNKAEHGMPILAFHGTDDQVNPWAGNGNPTYWKSSVISAFSKWAVSNGCSVPSGGSPWHRVGETKHVEKIELSEGCTDGATTVLVKLEGAMHTWPGAAGAEATNSGTQKGFLGVCNREISANEMMREFFDRHHLPMSMLPASVFTEIQAKNAAKTSVSKRTQHSHKSNSADPRPEALPSKGSESGDDMGKSKSPAEKETAILTGHVSAVVGILATGVLLPLVWFLVRRYSSKCRIVSVTPGHEMLVAEPAVESVGTPRTLAQSTDLRGPLLPTEQTDD